MSNTDYQYFAMPFQNILFNRSAHSAVPVISVWRLGGLVSIRSGASFRIGLSGWIGLIGWIGVFGWMLFLIILLLIFVFFPKFLIFFWIRGSLF